MRRREPHLSDDRPVAPVWVRQWNFGRVHFGAFPVDGLGQGSAWRAFRRAQDEWCVETGCHRAGKSCAEVFNRARTERPCGAEERLGA